MLNQTRSGRISKGRGRGAVRGRRGTASNAGTLGKWSKSSKEESKDAPISGSKSSSPEGNAELPKPVPRKRNDLEAWNKVPDNHLSFVSHGTLATDEDTETIAKNLVDHFIMPEHWDEGLRQNLLSTTCFYFASKLLEKNNTAEQIAVSSNQFSADHVRLLAELGIASPISSEQLMSSLMVTADDIEKGYAIMLSQKAKLRDSVGRYAEILADLTEKDDDHWHFKGASERQSKMIRREPPDPTTQSRQQVEGVVKESNPASPSQSPHEVGQMQDIPELGEVTLGSGDCDNVGPPPSGVEEDSLELDEFDRYVEENE